MATKLHVIQIIYCMAFLIRNLGADNKKKEEEDGRKWKQDKEQGETMIYSSWLIIDL